MEPASQGEPDSGEPDLRETEQEFAMYIGLGTLILIIILILLLG